MSTNNTALANKRYVAATFRRVLRERGEGQSDFAIRAGWSRQYVSRILSDIGDTNFTLNTVAEAASLLDLDFSVSLSKKCPECSGKLPWCLLRDRIQNYLGNGGLFNPEMMDHDKVRDLLMDALRAIDAIAARTEGQPGGGT